MTSVTGTLSRYFGLRFMWSALAAFGGVLLLVALIDYIELMRRTSDLTQVSALTVLQTSIFRVPQVTERILPFCVMVADSDGPRYTPVPLRAGWSLPSTLIVASPSMRYRS